MILQQIIFTRIILSFDAKMRTFSARSLRSLVILYEVSQVSTNPIKASSLYHERYEQENIKYRLITKMDLTIDQLTCPLTQHQKAGYDIVYLGTPRKKQSIPVPYVKWFDSR